ncbi:MAG: hypothetical protein GXY61_06195 [Lentisphaerae bacterium]|nr:hypothetical protein [Lentisphaerota bacterium]
MQNLLEEILKQCREAAKSMITEEAEAFISDTTSFLNTTRDDLHEWTRQFGQGEIDTDDLEWLMDMKKDVAEMQALKCKGIAKIRIEELQKQMLSIVTSAISSTI